MACCRVTLSFGGSYAYYPGVVRAQESSWLVRGRLRRSVLVLLWVLASSETGTAQVVWPSEIEQVSRALTGTNVVERRQASSRLVELPPAVIAKLVESALKDTDSVVRLNAARAAAQHPVPRSGAVVAGWLNDPNSELRLAALRVLRLDPSQDRTSLLARALSDTAWEVRLAAVEAIGALNSGEAALILLGHLDDPENRVRRAVFRQLATLGDPRSVVPLIGKGSDPDAEIRVEVLHALGALKDRRSLTALLTGLKDRDQAVRVAALDALGQLRDVSAVPMVAALLAEFPRDLEQAAALSALSKIGGSASVEAVLAALTSRDPGANLSEAREALVRLGLDAGPALRRCVARPGDVETADRCLDVWSEIDPALAGTVADSQVKSGTVSRVAALKALGAGEDVRFLAEALAGLLDENPVLRSAARKASLRLLQANPSQTRAVDPIVEALDRFQKEEPVLLEHLTLLGQTGAERASAALLPYAKPDNPLLVRVAAIQALGKLAPGAYDRAILELVADEDPKVAGEAALSLRQVGRAEILRPIYVKLETAVGLRRRALLVALFGALSRTEDQAVVDLALGHLRQAEGVERDLWLEALGAAEERVLLSSRWSPEGGTRLGVADRRKVAESFGKRPESLALLRALSKDHVASVRATAAWAWGRLASREDAPALRALTKDRDIDVAVNAVASLSQVSVRTQGSQQRTLCALLAERHPYVRANALVGLRGSPLACPKRVRDVAHRDPSDLVRTAASALLLGRRATKQRPREPLTVLVVPVGSAKPEPEAAFALRLADGLIRAGTADRRGAVSEPSAAFGEVRLLVPAHLAW